MSLILLVVLILLFGGVGGLGLHNGNNFVGQGGISLGAILLIVLIVLLVQGRH